MIHELATTLSGQRPTYQLGLPDPAPSTPQSGFGLSRCPEEALLQLGCHCSAQASLSKNEQNAWIPMTDFPTDQWRFIAKDRCLRLLSDSSSQFNFDSFRQTIENSIAEQFTFIIDATERRDGDKFNCWQNGAASSEDIARIRSGFGDLSDTQKHWVEILSTTCPIESVRDTLVVTDSKFALLFSRRNRPETQGYETTVTYSPETKALKVASTCIYKISEKAYREVVEQRRADQHSNAFETVEICVNTGISSDGKLTFNQPSIRYFGTVSETSELKQAAYEGPIQHVL